MGGTVLWVGGQIGDAAQSELRTQFSAQASGRGRVGVARSQVLAADARRAAAFTSGAALALVGVYALVLEHWRRHGGGGGGGAASAESTPLVGSGGAAAGGVCDSPFRLDRVSAALLTPKLRSGAVAPAQLGAVVSHPALERPSLDSAIFSRHGSM